jgi:hypothetical protein
MSRTVCKKPYGFVMSAASKDGWLDGMLAPNPFVLQRIDILSSSRR